MKIAQIENDGLATWTDSYNEGQVMNRLIQTARIADQTGNITARDKMIATIKERLEDWLLYQSGEKAFLFYYNDTWSAMFGYPAGHGQDTNINDHHFHWGYFIHAAAFMEQFEPGWADNWGEMINLLIRDAASADRNDTQFPLQTAIEEYWFDMSERNFQPSQQYSLVSRVWGNSYDNGTFWTSDITASYGIELYPMHGGSLYLGQNLTYVQKIWDELKTYTGILSDSDTNPNLWHDTFWKYLSFLDPAKAIELYDAYPSRNLKFGISDVQTYHWLHAMNAMGSLDASITANYPIAAVFNNNGDKTYVAHNYSDAPISVTFSDGFVLDVPANQMATTTLLGEDTVAPYEFKATNLQLGIHGVYAKVYVGSNFNVTNIISIQVGEQRAYSETPINIPGVIESGHFDVFEGGIGQNIAYVDVSINNEGDFRTSEYVDASLDASEGAIVGYIAPGEWLEYTINVETAGIYDLIFRYTSGNTSGGGPFYFEIDGKKISPDITVTNSGDWAAWTNKVVNNIELNKGEHVLRLVVTNGEFNLGKMTFSYNSPLPYAPPVASAGSNISVILPTNTATLDGSQSEDADTSILNYNWQQIYGPSTIAFSDATNQSPSISNLEEGIYKVELTVSDGTHSSKDTALVIVTQTGNTSPTVSITSPSNNTTFKEGEAITINVSATDLDGTIALVEFYDGETKLGEDTTAPYRYTWSNASVGAHQISAKATDNANGESTSQIIDMSVDEVKICVETGNTAIQGTFTTGYKSTFETIGSNVIVTFELLDTNRSSGNAYLWQESPFTESGMDFVSTNVFTKTLSGLSDGTTIRYACKFEFAGGLAVSDYVSYVVGSDCGSVAPTCSDGIQNQSETGVDCGGPCAACPPAGNTGLPFDFETTPISGDFTSFDGGSATVETVASPQSTGNTSNNLAKLVRNGGQVWAGAFLDLDAPLNFTSQKYITLRLWTDAPIGTPVNMKLEQQSNPGNNVELSGVFTTVTGGWETLIWDFSASGSSVFDRLVFLFDIGNTGNGAATSTFYFDDVQQSGTLGTENRDFHSIKVFPNPTEASWTVQTSGFAMSSIQVFNVLGKKVVALWPNSRETKIEASNLESGLYFAQIKTADGIHSIKLIKK